MYYDRLCHTRELAIVQMEEPEIKQLMPEIYHNISSVSKVSYCIVTAIIDQLLLIGYVCICNGVSF